MKRAYAVLALTAALASPAWSRAQDKMTAPTGQQGVMTYETPANAPASASCNGGCFEFHWLPESLRRHLPERYQCSSCSSPKSCGLLHRCGSGCGLLHGHCGRRFDGHWIDWLTYRPLSYPGICGCCPKYASSCTPPLYTYFVTPCEKESCVVAASVPGTISWDAPASADAHAKK